MLHEIVCPADTFTQRTRYDWAAVSSSSNEENMGRGEWDTCLAVDFELLHAGHGCRLWQLLEPGAGVAL